MVEVINDALQNIQTEYDALMNEKGYLDQVLSDGADKARGFAEKTLVQVKERMGFLPPRI